jgi:cell division protein FtsB
MGVQPMSRRMLSGQGPSRAGGPVARGGAAVARGGRGFPRTDLVLTRSARRPAKARRPADDHAVRRTRAVRARRFSGRATVLGLLLLALALAYAYPVRVYLAQQAEIARVQAAQTAQRQRIAQLNAQLSDWADDQYVIAQAKRRLHYVRPGEVAYVIVDGRTGSPAGTGGSAAGTGSWFSQLWSNIQAADNPRQR